VRQTEKDNLLHLFADSQNWCQHAEARDSSGNPVRYNDTAAVSWDLVGGICHLFGWDRACKLFIQLSKLQAPQRYFRDDDKAISAMIQLQDFNDADDTTYEKVLNRISAVKATN
jgi:hypothetical protein